MNNNYITWNDAIDIPCIPYVYMCEICNQRIMDKKCKGIRVRIEDKTTNHYFHNYHIAIAYADWLHKINNRIKYGQEKSI